MDIKIISGMLSGRINARSSSALLQRYLAMSALCPSKTTLFSDSFSDDVAITISCLEKLGCRAIRNGLRIVATPLPRGNLPESPTLDFGKSLTTLGLLLPLCCSLKYGALLTGSRRSLRLKGDRSLAELARHGATIEFTDEGIKVGGGLKPGEYRLAGSFAPLVASGLMLVTPLMKSTSMIKLTGDAAGSHEPDVTMYALKRAGINIARSYGGYVVPGGQRYGTIEALGVEGEPASALPWLVMDRMGCKIKVGNLEPSSSLPYCDISAFFDDMGGEIDVAGRMDALPYLAIAAAASPGLVTVFTGVESGGAHSSGGCRALARLLSALGCDASLDGTTLSVTGVATFSGGELPTNGDPTLTVAAAVAAARAGEDVIIRDAERADIVYPDFFKRYRDLGGVVEEI